MPVEIVQQQVVGLMMLAAVLGLGLPAAAAATAVLRVPLPTAVALGPLVGLATVGAATLVAGHLGAIGPWLPAGYAAVGVVTAVLTSHQWIGWLRSLARAVGAHSRHNRVLVAATIAALALAVAATWAAPFRIDEIEYQWPAAVAWAEAGRWVDVPYRHADGFPFMNVIWTVAATRGSWVAAHQMTLLTLVCCGLAAAGAARAVGVRGTVPVAAATMAMPVVWDGSYVSMNDTPVGAFGLAAVAVALGARGSTRSMTAACCLLVAVAVSVKPTAGGAAVAVAVAFWSRFRVVDRPPQGWGSVARPVAWVGVVTLATLVAWSARRALLTGDWLDPLLVGPPSADVASRLPDALDRLVWPFVPALGPVIGSLQPWGSRLAVVLLLLVPSAVYVLRVRGAPARGYLALAAPAMAHWLVLGVATVRTRFHVVSWGLLVGAVRLALEHWAAQRGPRAQRAAEMVWTAAVLLGLVDVSMEMLRVASSL